MSVDVKTAIVAIRSKARLSQEALSHLLGVSFVSVNRWERGTGVPSLAHGNRILQLYQNIMGTDKPSEAIEEWGKGKYFDASTFASYGAHRSLNTLPLFAQQLPKVQMNPAPLEPISSRLSRGRFWFPQDENPVRELLSQFSRPAITRESPPQGSISAGKNTYTYDAHTYHTKVPPQGIAELLKYYLPEGGLVLDPFAGSGMTGVAARVLGHSCILNELSPAACFIANRFVSKLDAQVFEAGVKAILREVEEVRRKLYTTTCRECGKPTEALYLVWSYNVICYYCQSEFLLWNVCRKYGSRVREHKILTEFPCPNCNSVVKKSRLKRTFAEPVLIGYKCCGSRQQEVVHPPDHNDLELIYSLEIAAPYAEGFYPTTPLPDGVNLRQPKRHGFDAIHRFYTPRNLSAMSHLWKAIHRIEDVELAAHLAFVHTSLYQRVTRLSEFRFWGGSGNTARFNVPFVFNEANVFVTFERKARTILDHLETTANRYQGTAIVVQNSATNLDYLPDESIDLIFTDPPFGANINYSEMNLLWESWLGKFTDNTTEAVINPIQGKGIEDYRRLMTLSLAECYRVLREGHWLLLMFMNSSSAIWGALRQAIGDAGFEIIEVDMFDKEHGTFKQFVSENTAGYDLVIHCRKPPLGQRLPESQLANRTNENMTRESVSAFLRKVDLSKYRSLYLHVSRPEEVDIRKLYSEWAAGLLRENGIPVNLTTFRSFVEDWLHSRP